MKKSGQGNCPTCASVSDSLSFIFVSCNIVRTAPMLIVILNFFISACVSSSFTLWCGEERMG